METKHVKFNYEEALEAKKELLSAELGLIELAKRIKNFKTLRKRELSAKDKLKTALKNIKVKIKLIHSTFPPEEVPKTKQEIKEKKIKRQHEQNIKDELQEIEEKLASLQ